MKTHFIFFSLIGFGLGSGVANGAINPANPSQEKPAFIAIVKHHTDKIQKRVESDGTTTTSYTRVKDYNAQYQPNASDNDWAIKFHGTVNDYSQEPDSWRKTVYNWSEMANSTYTYSTNSDGTESFDPYIVESWCSRENSIVPDADLRSLGSPGYCDEIHVHWILHYYARKVKHHWDYPDGVKEEVGVNARTEMKLFTGGKSGVKRKSLIHITANALANGEPYAYPWTGTPTTPVDATKIKVLGWWLFGRHLDNNGDLFIVLPDNTERDLNLRVPGVKHYDAHAEVQKVNLDLRTVTFENRNGDIQKDDGSGNYDTPHFVRDDAGKTVQSYPALYVSGQEVQTTTEFKTVGGGFPVVIKGEVSGGHTSFTLWATNDTGAPMSGFAAFPDQPLTADLVDFYDSMKIKWYYGDIHKKDFIYAGQSINQVYVTLRAPTNGVELFHTTVHLSCKNAAGETTDAGCTAKIWSEFTDRDVRRVDGTRLTYYSSWSCVNADTATLLANGDGQCAAWAYFFLDMRQIQGVDEPTNYVTFKPNLLLNGITVDKFIVKN
jgi:hypothetical protein